MPALAPNCRRRRRTVQILSAALLLPTFPLSAQAQMALSAAINRAGSFRALSQRIVKAYCQLHLNVLPDKAREVLALSRLQIASGLADLSRGIAGGAWPASVASQLEKLQREAAALLALLTDPPTRQSVQQVAQQADRMLATAQAATEAIEKLSPAPTARLVNVSGRQRMLSQRMAKGYFLAAAGWADKSLAQAMAADAATFLQALADLGRSPISTPAIRAELQQGENQWMFFDIALRQAADVNGLRTVATTSERLLEVFNHLTDLYDAALKDVLG